MAIVAIALITIAGSRNGNTTAYAAEVEAEENDNGIINSSVWNGTSTEPTEDLYFGNNGESNQSRGVIQFNPIEINKEYTINIAFIGNPLISNNRQAISYVFNTKGNFTGATYGSTTYTINPDGMTEINLTYTDTQAVNYFIFEFYNNTNSTGTANEYWVNMLLFQIRDSNDNYLVNYQSYLYDYLKTQFDNANSSGYDEGLDHAQYGIFANAKVEKAYMESTNKTLDASLKFINGGISLENYALAAEPEGNPNSFIVLIDVTDFEWKNNLLFNPISTGVEITLITDKGNRIKTKLDTNNLDVYGYPIQAEYTGIISKIEVWNANFDYYGKILNPNQSIYNNGYNNGYNKGYEDGEASGYFDGKQNGYYNGYNQGYDKGYNEGVNAGNGLVSTISSLLSTVSAGLNVDIIGSISIGDLLNVALGVLLTFAVIRFFGGG